MGVPTLNALNTAIESWRDASIATGAIAINTPAYNQVYNAIADLEARVGATIDDVSESSGVGIFTTSGNLANNDTISIGKLDGTTKVYTLQSALTNVDGNVKVGATEALTLANLHHAINGTGGVAGTDYATATTAHPDVTATDDAAHALTVTAKVPGVAGNLPTTKVAANGSWGSATMTGGTGEDEPLAIAAIDAWRDTLRGTPIDGDDASVTQLDTAVTTLKTTVAALFT